MFTSTVVYVRSAYKRAFSSEASLYNVISNMKEETKVVNGKTYFFLVCDKNHLLSEVISHAHNIIVVRESTVEQMNIVEEALESECQKVLFTGTEGVGKTINIIIWLFYILNKRTVFMSFNRVVFECGETYYFRKIGSVWYEDVVSPGADKRLKILYLCDATAEKLPSSTALWKRVVFASPSPNMKCFRDFVKANVTQLLVMYVPVWKWREVAALFAELKLIDPANNTPIPIADIHDLFFKWGGIPREVFAPRLSSLSRLNSLIMGCNPEALIQACTIVDVDHLECETTARSLLIHMIVDKNTRYQSAKMDFGSSFIRDQLLVQSRSSVSTLYSIFVKDHRGQEYAASMRDSLFKAFVVSEFKMAHDTNWTDRRFLTFTMGRKNAKSKVAVIRLPRMTEVSKTFGELNDINTKGRVWIPLVSNFKSFDLIHAADPAACTGLASLPALPALIAGGDGDSGDSGVPDLAPLIARSAQAVHPPAEMRFPFCVQITVGQDHSLNAKGVRECLNHFPTDQAEIVFCLPPDVFQHWYLENNAQTLRIGKKSIMASEVFDQLQALPQRVICMACTESDELAVTQAIIALKAPVQSAAVNQLEEVLRFGCKKGVSN